MVAKHRGLGWIALVVGGLATLRIVLFGFLDKRPHFDGAENGDLGVLMRNHQAFRAPGGFDLEQLLELIRLEHHQPPLYYQGVAALFAPLETLSSGPLLLTNAATLALGLWAAWAFGVQLGRPRLGLLAVVVLACLRLVAGRFTILGVEPWHMALLGVSIVLFLRLREPDSTQRQAVLLGAVIGVGLLMKLSFVAGLLGPLLLESLSALRGGPSTRAWLRRLLLAGGVVVGLFVVGYLPFAGSPTDFVLMATSESTHSSLLTLDAVSSLLTWALLGVGPVGVILLLMALLGAGLSRSWETPSPALGRRPVSLLLASIVSLGVIHWLVPHKEIRYLVPAAWSFSVLVAMGLEPFLDWGRRGRIAVTVALLSLAVSTFVLPRGVGLGPVWGPLRPYLYDPQVPHFRQTENVVELEPTDLRLWIDHSDYGIEELVRHESFDELDRSLVLATLEDPRGWMLRNMLQVELYLRNDRPVISLPTVPNLLPETLDLDDERPTHVVTNRLLPADEIRVLLDHGFVEARVVELPLPGPKHWRLWTKTAARGLNTDFAKDLGDWTLWSDAPAGEPHSYQLRQMWLTDSDFTGPAAVLSGDWTPGTGSDQRGGGSFAMQHLFKELDDFHLSFRWRAYSDGDSVPRARLELVDVKDGTLLHRQEMSLGIGMDRGWFLFPPTDFSDALPTKPLPEVYVRIGLHDETPGAGSQVVQLDNFELVRQGIEPPPASLLATEETAEDVAAWSSWVLGSGGRADDYSVSLDETEGIPAPAIHLVEPVRGQGATPHHGLERRLPVTLPFTFSMDWLTRSGASGPPPSLMVELRSTDGIRLHAWKMAGDGEWSRYAPPDLSQNVLGLSEVILRVGVAGTGEAGPAKEFWIDNFAWSAPCASPQPYYADLDGDGYGNAETQHPWGALCYPLPGWVIDPADCDDGDASSYPGAQELCDGLDNDCEPATLDPGELDEDGDGRLLCEGDCDDTDPATYKGAIELCDGIDNDCNGLIEDATTDTDGDGVALCDGDCDDSNPDIWPGGIEHCHDGLDSDCDGTEARDGIDTECADEDGEKD